MSRPLPPPAPPTPNRVASVAVAIGVAAVVGGALLGIFMLRLHPGLVGGLALLLAGAAIGTGVAGIVSASRRQGRGMIPAIVAVVLGMSTFACLFVGRVFGAEVLGLTTWA